MNMTGKEKWMIGILLIIMILSFLIPFGNWYFRHQSVSVPTVSTEITAPEETVMQPVTTLPKEVETPVTLKMMLGENYVQSLTETITMQMENRMDKNPDVRYYPITDHAPLGNYVTIGEETQFKVDEEGCLVISFPAGTVTDAANGVQKFRIQKVATGQKG